VVERPRFLHAITYRFKGHVSSTRRRIATAEVSKALQNDPLIVAARKLSEAMRARVSRRRIRK
jgi:TPP-dependent pyruvate/acetoin dehydrogenase alpha subunit